MAALGARRVMLLTDARLAQGESVHVALSALRAAGIDTVLFDEVRIEPSDSSFEAAIAFARDGNFDGYVAVGGGSVMDTAKAVNLYACWPPDDFLAYVNPPIGRGLPVPGPLRPLIAVPTTAGTGSETTGVAIFDYEPLRAKTGIAQRALRPTLGIIDPHNTAMLPPMVAACSGLDVLSHAIESLTALPYAQRVAPAHPRERPAYQGANPVSDVWAAEALRMVGANLLRAIRDPADEEARGNMLLAAAWAGIGFGNAGVHLPHGMSYPVSGMVRDFRPPGYQVDHSIVPHGMAVILNAPAVFRFTAGANPQRHLLAARLLGLEVADTAPQDAGEILAAGLIELMRATGMPNGLGALGYCEADAPALAEGTLPQHRVTKLSPRPAGREELIALFRAAMRYW